MLTSIDDSILRRQHKLREIALNGATNNCSSLKIIGVKEPYGGAGNLWIMLANMLWLGHLMDATLEIPWWGKERVFHYFDLDVFSQAFCTTKLTPPTTESRYTLLPGAEAYYIRKIYNDGRLKKNLPALNE